MIKKIGFFAFVIVAVLVIIESVNSIYSLWQKNDLIEQSRQELVRQKSKNKELQEDLKRVNKPQFVEEEARNKLFMVRPGEGIVVMAPTEYVKASESAKAKKPDTRPNWQKWQDLFF